MEAAVQLGDLHAVPVDGSCRSYSLGRSTWLGATTAGARAVDVPASAFYFSSELSGQTSLPECLPEDLVGTVTGTEVTEGHATDTGFTFHANGTTTLTYRVGFP